MHHLYTNVFGVIRITLAYVEVGKHLLPDLVHRVQLSLYKVMLKATKVDENKIFAFLQSKYSKNYASLTKNAVL